MDYRGGKVPSDLVDYLQGMGKLCRQDGKSENDGTIHRNDRKPKAQWEAEKKAERQLLAWCSWVACNRGKCQAWQFFKDFNGVACPACNRRWADTVLQRALECGGKTPGYKHEKASTSAGNTGTAAANAENGDGDDEEAAYDGTMTIRPS